MRRLMAVMGLLVLGLAGCDTETGDREREMRKYEGKTISEAYLQNSKTAVIRFDDGTMLEIEHRGDRGLVVNNQDD